MRAEIAGGRAGHDSLAETRRAHPIVSRISAGLGGVRYPSKEIWLEPLSLLADAERALRGERLYPQARAFEEVAEASDEANAQVITYREGSIRGAGGAARGLVITRNVSAVAVGVMATIATGGAAAGLTGVAKGKALTAAAAKSSAVSASYKGAQEFAAQTSGLLLGMRESVDWRGIAFDTTLDFVLGVAFNRLGDKIRAALNVRHAFSTTSQKVVSDAYVRGVISEVITGRGKDVVELTAKSLFENARRNGERINGAEFIDRLAEELTLDKVFLDALAAGAGQAGKDLFGSDAAKEIAKGGVKTGEKTHEGLTTTWDGQSLEADNEARRREERR